MPERSIETLERLAGAKGSRPDPLAVPDATHPEAQLSSEELQRLAHATEGVLDKTLDELHEHVAPDAVKERMKKRLRSPGLMAGVATVAAGIVGMHMARRHRHA
jgi:hypothetical protein